MALQTLPTTSRLIKRGVHRTLRCAGAELVRYPGRQRVRILRHHRITRVIDVGANAGQYGADLRRFGYTGEIISFEPLVDAYQELARRAAQDPAWHTEMLALGDETRRAAINVSRNSVSSSLLPMMERHQRAAPGSEYTRTQTIEVRRLDEVMTRYPGHHGRTLLKVDAQGFERHVLLGATELLRQVRGLQIELSLVPLYSGQMIFDEAIGLITGQGLRLASIEPGFSDRETGEMLQFDGIFVRAPTVAAD
ncbi:FkbM family methyltransferase [Streptomyces tailanensis]|uniref:FkbM family methyltransferase n=1 Tax=Streptomyces tailanensis TaxID=2569858 RepID=UPI00155A2695|nr:FkbM family methyltransferase [Streptomyces tailanensis]